MQGKATLKCRGFNYMSEIARLEGAFVGLWDTGISFGAPQTSDRS